MDLAASSAALHEPQNRLYESRFLSELLSRFRRKIELYPGLYNCAFLSLEPGDAGYWAERTLLDFLLATVEG